MVAAGIVFISILLGAVLYQLISGRLLDRSWKTFTTRNERPRLYWSAMAFETAVTLTTAYFIVRDLLAIRH